jgi:hypothetical protein
MGYANLTFSVEINSTGFGATAELAIENAKLNALSQASGELLVSKRSFDGVFKEELLGYTNGILDSYQLLGSLCSRSICEATILAVVTKRSDITYQESKVGDIPRFANDDPNLINYLKNQENWLVLTIKNIAYEDRLNGVVQATAYGYVQVNSIWLDALKKYMQLNPSVKMDRLILIDKEKYHADVEFIFASSSGVLSHIFNIRVCLQDKDRVCHFMSDGYGAKYGFSHEIFDFELYYRYTENWHRHTANAYMINTSPFPFEYTFQANKKILQQYQSIKVVPMYLGSKSKRGMM